MAAEVGESDGGEEAWGEVLTLLADGLGEAEALFADGGGDVVDDGCVRGVLVAMAGGHGGEGAWGFGAGAEEFCEAEREGGGVVGAFVLESG